MTVNIGVPISTGRIFFKDIIKPHQCKTNIFLTVLVTLPVELLRNYLSYAFPKFNLLVFNLEHFSNFEVIFLIIQVKKFQM